MKFKLFSQIVILVLVLGTAACGKPQDVPQKAAPTLPVVTEPPPFTPPPTEQAPQPNLPSTPGDGGSQNPTGSLFDFILLGGLGLISSRFFGFSV